MARAVTITTASTTRRELEMQALKLREELEATKFEQVALAFWRKVDEIMFIVHLKKLEKQTKELAKQRPGNT